MRLTDDWINLPATRAVTEALTSAGYQALFVGGCVRNALLGAAVSDIDLSTDALPDEVMRVCRAVGLKAIPTGIEHGTVTVVSDGIPHEITTFRRDMATDGRRAVVAFSKDVTDDARRRDFTMNALYADPSGAVIDPLGGLPDLKARRLRFIEDPAQRIREDYLRILRFFRFHAWYGDPDQGMDPEALAAIAAHLDGIETLSRERVGAELIKLLAAKDPAPALAAMRSSGALGAALPGSDDKAIGPLVHFEGISETAPDAIRRLAALCQTDAAETLRLSKPTLRRHAKLRDWISRGPVFALGYRLGAQDARDVVLLTAAMLEQPLPDDWQDDIGEGATQVFPISAGDLPKGLKGAEIGAALRQMEEKWLQSRFTLSAQALLSELGSF